jgi:hypothetical protein
MAPSTKLEGEWRCAALISALVRASSVSNGVIISKLDGDGLTVFALLFECP